MAAPPRSARTPAAGISPAGLRAGDPATCEALCERRGAAVLAYCEHVAAPAVAIAAAAEGFARFRATVIATPASADVDPDLLLLSATRHAAAEHAPQPARARIAAQLGAGHRKPQACALVPELLAARAEGLLSEADRLRLDRHVRSCRSCEEAEHRFDAAEAAYRNPPDAPPDATASAAIVSALTAAAGADAGAAELGLGGAAEPPGADPGPDWPPEPPVVSVARAAAPARSRDDEVQADDPPQPPVVSAARAAPPAPPHDDEERAGDPPQPPVVSAARAAAPAPPHDDDEGAGDPPERRTAVIIDHTLGEDIADLQSTLDGPAHHDSPAGDDHEIDDTPRTRPALPPPPRPGRGRATRRGDSNRSAGAIRPLSTSARRRPLWALALPVLVVVAAILAALAIAGVLHGGGGHAAAKGATLVPATVVPAAAPGATSAHRARHHRRHHPHHVGVVAGNSAPVVTPSGSSPAASGASGGSPRPAPTATRPTSSASAPHVTARSPAPAASRPPAASSPAGTSIQSDGSSTAAPPAEGTAPAASNSSSYQASGG